MHIFRPTIRPPARRFGPCAAAASATALVLVLAAAPASAHVTIDNDEQPAGSFAVLHFQVPNESDTATTTKLEISLPNDVVIPFVLPRTTNGWRATVAKRKLDTPVQGEGGTITEVVATVTFEGGTIPVGQFDLFDLELGPLPDAPGTSLAFPAVQTYSDGRAVRWIEQTIEGQAEPEHPAPLLTLTAAGGEEATSSDGNGLAVVGIVLGAIGTVGAAGAAFVATRRRT